jgi:enoyl-CoA hydratase/carnithine racemase
MTQKIRIEQHDAIRTISLSRADVRNAFDEQMIAEISAAFLDVSTRPVGARGGAGSRWQSVLRGRRFKLDEAHGDL